MEPGVALSFRDEAFQPDVCLRRSFAGLTIEHVRMQGAQVFEYKWTGRSNYLAVHDILLSDGEIAVGSDHRSNSKDLRKRLTFVPSGALVSGWSQLEGVSGSYTALFFDPGLAEAEHERPLIASPTGPMLYFEDAKLCSTMERIKQSMSEGESFDPLSAETLGLLAALQVSPLLNLAVESSKGQLSSQQQRQLRSFIDERIGSPVSLSDLANVVGLSRYHFARSFSRTFGRAPHQYVLLRRISLAATLLVNTKISITEIAIRVGFSSPARLTTAFRRITGTTPRLFRQASR